MMHLDAPSYAALLDGTLRPEEARRLAGHLEEGCAECEQFLAGRDPVDRLDGATDAAIAAALPAGDGAGNELEFARIRRAVASRPVARRRLLSVAGAALLVLGVGLVVRETARRADAPAGWDGEKGARPRGIPARLRYLEVQQGGRILKGISGERVSASSSLVFEVEVGRAADLVLLRVAPDGGAELMWRSRVAGGSAQVMLGGRPAAYPLSGVSGPQRFVLVASERPISDARAIAAAAALAPPSIPSADAPALDGLSLDVVDVSVR